MQMGAREVQNDRMAVAQACAQKFNAIVVLKGARSVVALPENQGYNAEHTGHTFINLTATQAWRPGVAVTFSPAPSRVCWRSLRCSSCHAAGRLSSWLGGDLEYSEKGNGLISATSLKPCRVRCENCKTRRCKTAPTRVCSGCAKWAA
jgi:hypothetical protein